MEKLPEENLKSLMYHTCISVGSEINKENEINNKWPRTSVIEIKYPTFSIPQIDEELKYEITYENVMNDLRFVFDILDDYINLYTNILIKNPHNILASFQKYKLNFLIFHVNSFLLKRHIELLCFLIKYKFEECNEIEKKLKLNFVDKSVDDLIFMWTSNNKYIANIFEQIDDPLEIKENFAIGLDTEKFMIEQTLFNDEKPSLSGLGIFIKYFKYILQSAIETMKIITMKESEETMLNFLQDVIIN